jgi:hypothetical protein
MDEQESPEVIKRKISMIKHNEEKEISTRLQKVYDRQYNAQIKSTENWNQKSTSAKWATSKIEKVKS